MSDAQRQRTPGTNGALHEAAPETAVTMGDGEHSLGLEDVKFDADEAAAHNDAAGSPVPVSMRPAGAITVSVVGRTDVGLVREHNEDNLLLADLGTGSRDPSTFHEVSPSGLLLAVCDGMGGAAAGEVASQMAVDTVFEMMRRSVPASDRDALARALVRAIEEAGGRIFEAARADRSRRGMGTTSTVAALMDKTLFVGQVGDSRAYILRNGELKQITKDQSLVNQLIEAGQLTEDEAEAFEHSNIILQALGTTEQVSVDLTFLELRRGDRLVMCSDGLSGLVHGDVIREVMVEYQDLSACCDRLIELAKAGGGHDDVTVILCDFGGEGLAPTQPTDLAGYQQYPLPMDEGGHKSASHSSDSPTLAPPSNRPDSHRAAHDEFGDIDGRSQRSASSSLRYIVLLIVVIAIAGAVYYWNDRSRQAIADQPPLDAPVATPVVPEAPSRVEVVVRTDVEGGELVVDGESYGTVVGDRWVLDLLPGPHKLEARSGGNTVTSSLVSVREGVPATVLLSMPEGADGAQKQDGGPSGAVEGKLSERERRRDARSKRAAAASAESGDDEPAAEAAEPTGSEEGAKRHRRKKPETKPAAEATPAPEVAPTPAPTP
jgi:serine/threonine protein phosphatase PrpC